MKRTASIVLTGILALGASGVAYAEEMKTPKPIVVSEKTTLKATVEAIDKANRMVTLKGPKGQMVTLPVDESVARFDEIKVGDHINAEYYESITVTVNKPGVPAAPDSMTGAAASMEGKKPGGAIAAQASMTVTIENIDPVAPSVTVRTADGNSQSFRVRNKKYLKDVKVGDTVTITKTEALMVAVKESK